MTEQSDVKVFISWSGDLAKSVTSALREWLPLLFDRVVPWASETDIAAGQRGLAQIETELADTRFGLVIVTADNQHAPWLNFEAGALSKSVTGDAEHRVVPLLVNLASPADLTGPLAQFQARTVGQSGVRDVIRSLAAAAGVDAATADKRFDAYWPDLEKRIAAAKAEAPGDAAATPERRGEADVMEEILLHVRSLRSDQEKPSLIEPTPTVTQRHQHEFQQFVTNLAAAHGMDVYDIRGSAFDEQEVVLSPKGKYNEATEETVKNAFYKVSGKKYPNVKISVIPF